VIAAYLAGHGDVLTKLAGLAGPSLSDLSNVGTLAVLAHLMRLGDMHHPSHL
jgi:hypothetical protein